MNDNKPLNRRDQCRPERVEPPVEYLRKCLDADYETGVLRWKARPLEHFKNQHAQHSFNTHFAGKPAGAIDKRGRRSFQFSVNGRKRQIYVPRALWAMATGAWPIDQLDHRNGRPADNRLINLREATGAQNQQNMKKRFDNASGRFGVSWAGRRRKWTSQIKIGRRKIHLGSFEDSAEGFADASGTYLAAKTVVHKFQPVPRDATPLVIRPIDRMSAARRIITAARRFGDPSLEIEAWTHFIDAMSPTHNPDDHGVAP